MTPEVAVLLFCWLVALAYHLLMAVGTVVTMVDRWIH